MDKITEALLTEFTSEFGLSTIAEDSRFEQFAAWVTTRRHYSDTTFDPSDLVTGSGGDTGIDAIAIIANNNLTMSGDLISTMIRALKNTLSSRTKT